MNTRPSLRVLLLCDGLPGHANQARGLVQWMSARYDIECTEIEVRLRLRALARLLLPWLLNRGPLGWMLVRYFYAMPDTDANSMQLIVSAGGNTSFLNVALARIHRIPNVFLGSKRRLHSHDFSAHLTLEPTGERNNLVMELVPTLVDNNALIEAGRALRQRAGSKTVLALIVGGDGAGFRYSEADWKGLAELVNEELERSDAQLLLTTSRRTGVTAEALLQRYILKERLLEAVWWHEAPQKVMAAYLGAADKIIVTADSMSMITEAISAQKTVAVVTPAKGAPEERYQATLDRFVELGYLSVFAASDQAPAWSRQPADMAAIRGRLLERLQSEIQFLKP